MSSDIYFSKLKAQPVFSLKSSIGKVCFSLNVGDEILNIFGYQTFGEVFNNSSQTTVTFGLEILVYSGMLTSEIVYWDDVQAMALVAQPPSATFTKNNATSPLVAQNTSKNPFAIDQFYLGLIVILSVALLLTFIAYLRARSKLEPSVSNL